MLKPPYVSSTAGLENSTRLLVFTRVSSCRASENLDIYSKLFFSPYMPIVFCDAGQVHIFTIFRVLNSLCALTTAESRTSIWPVKYI